MPMDQKANEGSSTPIRQFISSLESAADSLEELEDILSRPLTALHILPPGFRAALDVDFHSKDVTKAMSMIQHILLNTVLPTWLIPLQEAGHQLLIKAFFCPYSAKAVKQSEAIQFCKIAMSGLSTLLNQISSLNPTDAGPAAILAFSVSTISDITSQYPLDEVYESIFLSAHDNLDKGMQEWQDCIKIFCSIPGKVTNSSLVDSKFKVPNDLQPSSFFSNLCILTENILFKVSQSYPAKEDILLQSIGILVLKLLNLGFFPVSRSGLPSQISFFALTLPTIRRKVFQTSASMTQSNAASSTYSDTWAGFVRSLPLISQQTFLASLLASLDCRIGLDQTPSAIRKVGESARILHGIIGKLDVWPGNDEIWTALTAVICASGRTWDIGIARTIVSWVVVESQGLAANGAALSKLCDAVISLWTNPEYIRHALLHEHRYMTSFLLIVLAALQEPPNHLTLSPPFISSISTYLMDSDEAIRRCGMLVAEVVARRCGQKLAFEGWDGKGETFTWATKMRGWVNDWQLPGYTEEFEAEAEEPSRLKDELSTEVMQTQSPSIPPGAADSDDESLSGYSSSPDSSRTPSPSPSELAEIEKDPSLRVGRSKPIVKPVYLAQLVSMLRMEDDKDVVERIEIALSSAESLIRRKKGFGFELEENATELTMALTRLRNNYELEIYDEKRQGALIALVECCPRQSAVTLIEQVFTNQYSTSDRITMLTALAIGARTLANLAVSPSAVSRALQFPSKMLPPALHRRYATPGERDAAEGPVQEALSGITKRLLDQGKEEAEATLAHHPEIIREKRLRLEASRAGIHALHPESRSLISKQQAGLKPNPDAFTAIAAEYFIMPLVNHMWLLLRDTNTRVTPYGGAGTAVIFDTAVLTQFLDVLAVLVHAARHSSTFLAIIAPAALEMAMVLGSRPITLSKNDAIATRNDRPLASILTAGLEVALVVLDGSIELDQGKTIALEHGVLLRGISAWSGGVLDAVDVGRKMPGGGGEVEGKLAATAAGVVMNAQKIEGRWGRSIRTEY